jgi:hypothetical protein
VVVSFSRRDFAIFQQRNWEYIGKCCLFSVNSTKISKFLGLNLAKFSTLKKKKNPHSAKLVKQQQGAQIGGAGGGRHLFLAIKYISNNWHYSK